ncbi:WXG100 family type VII secretion target [Streptomyces sp. NPDC052396]|uniref:WXG100 family type VII secretion target n=1 Tax=Streptomyces sp. NPDC052396 TaxID=3365689 RepID=UPI0037D80CDE
MALHDAAATLRKTLDGLGSPWGGDDPGKKFHDSYGPAKKSIDTAVDVLVKGLQSISGAMTTIAEGHSGNDHDIAAIFKKATQQIQQDSGKK